MLLGKSVDNQHGHVSKMFLFAPTIHLGQGEKGFLKRTFGMRQLQLQKCFDRHDAGNLDKVKQVEATRGKFILEN